MIRKGDCWDNAPSERFFSGLKREWLTGHCTNSIRMLGEKLGAMSVWLFQVPPKSRSSFPIVRNVVLWSPFLKNRKPVKWVVVRIP